MNKTNLDFDQFKYFEAGKGEYPICPFCERLLDRIMFKRVYGHNWFAKRKVIFFCPYCHKFLGVSVSDIPGI